jgi:small subunit ribosomal protein S16
MSATIRLARHGAKKKPFYRIVVADRRFADDGRRLEQLGVYDPRQSPSRLEIDGERVAEWLRRGARPSATVAQLIKKSGIQLAPADAPEKTSGESS